MALDLKTIIGLDDREFAKGAQRVRGKSRALGKDVDRAFISKSSDELVRKFATVDVAIQGIRRGFQSAGTAVAEYEARFPELVASMGAAEKATDRLRQGIGRDLFYAFNTVSGPMDTAIGMLEAWRLKAVNVVADVMHGRGAGEEADETRKNEEASIKRGREMLVLDEMSRASAIARLRVEEGLASARAGGDENLLRVRRELLEVDQRAERQLRALNALETVSVNERQKLADGIRAQAEQEKNLVRWEGKRRGLAKVDEFKKDQADVQAERERFALEEKGLRIGLMQLEGRQDEAQLARVMLDYERRRLQINRQNLGVEEKRRRIAILDGLERRTLAAARAGMNADNGERRTAAVGVLGGRNIVAQQLGADAQKTTARNTQRIAQQIDGLPPLLRMMIQAIQGQPGATFQ